MPTININGKDIDLPQNTIKQIEEALSEKKEVWKPKENEKYWYISEYADTSTYINNSQSDLDRISIGNCFQTKQEAQEVVDKLKAIQCILIQIKRSSV